MTAWNRDGVDWRQFTGVELVWLAHQLTYEALKRHAPNRVRKYLDEVGDLVLLARHDREKSSRETDLGTGGAP